MNPQTFQQTNTALGIIVLLGQRNRDWKHLEINPFSLWLEIQKN